MSVSELSERLGEFHMDDDNNTAKFADLRSKKDFRCMERVAGRPLNVLQGLELHTGVFSAADQQRIVDCVYRLQDIGRKGLLRDRTYLEPQKWMRGKGRITIQFGCCYNYAMDKRGNPPGIVRDEESDPIPPLFKDMIKRMVEWHVLPPTCVPDSCIVNIYEKDDCIPPHIDHHDFVRPFCTVSFLSECDILFGKDLKSRGPGDFEGPARITLPTGSVLILQGNGADVAKHCVPAVPSKRISITFRKMDQTKIPYSFVPDPDLQNLRPIPMNPPVTPIQRQNRPYRSPEPPSVRARSAPVLPTPSSTFQEVQSAQHPATPASAPAATCEEAGTARLKEQPPRQRQSNLQLASPQWQPPRQQASYPQGPRPRLAPQLAMKQVVRSLLSSDDFPPLGAAAGAARRSCRQ